MLAVSLVTLGSPDQLTGGYLYHRRMADLAPAHDARIRFVSFRPQPLPVAALQGPRVMRSAQRPPAHVLLLDSICAAFLAPWLALRRPRLPLAAILHQPPGGIDSLGARRKVQEILDVRAYHDVDVLILASEALRHELPPRLLHGREVVVVPPGRDVATEASDVGDLRHGWRAADLRQGRRAALLCVGNWVARKGILELLEAFAGLPEDAATLHLVGRHDIDPAYERQVRARLADPHLAHRVVIHGPVDSATVAGMYRAADVFVLASTKEPYGTVYGEAMAAGLPVVGWDAGNLPHLATHESEGLIVSAGDTTALRDALRRLTDDEALRTRLAAAAARKGMSFPTWEASAAQLFDVLKASAGRSR